MAPIAKLGVTEIIATDDRELARPSWWDRDPYRWIRFVRVWLMAVEMIISVALKM
jgi:hypothetical protein